MNYDDLLTRAKKWAPHDNCWKMHQELVDALEALLHKKKQDLPAVSNASHHSGS